MQVITVNVLNHVTPWWWNPSDAYKEIICILSDSISFEIDFDVEYQKTYSLKKEYICVHDFPFIKCTFVGQEIKGSMVFDCHAKTFLYALTNYLKYVTHDDNIKLEVKCNDD
jgi:hypothetical protein